MGSEQNQPLSSSFSVRWHNHESNLKNQLDQLLAAQSFVDATLVCQDICIRLHKSVMAASSSYLRNILLQIDSREHPVIILQDMDEMALQGLVTFMYKGVVDVSPEQLGPMLRCAKALKINGFLEAYAKTPPTHEETDLGGFVAPTANVASHSSTVDDDSSNADSLQPICLVDVSMDSGDEKSVSAAPPVTGRTTMLACSQPKRGRGRAKKIRPLSNNSPQPSSSKEFGTNAATILTGSSPVFMKRERLEMMIHEPPESFVRAKKNRQSSHNSPQPSSSKEFETAILTASSPSSNFVKQERLEMVIHEPPDSFAESSPSPALSFSLENDELHSSPADPDDEASRRSYGLDSAGGLHYQIDLPPLSPSSPSGSFTSGGLRKGRPPTGGGAVFTCRVCDKMFGRKHHMIQHLRTHDPARDTYHCEFCQRGYHRRSELHRHQKTSHLDELKTSHMDSNSNSNS